MKNNKTIAYIVSNPGINDARVIKMAKAAVKDGYKVYLFGVLKKGFDSYEEIEGITFIRFEWKPINILIETGILKMLLKINKKFAIYLAKKVFPYFKYNMFYNIFKDEIIKINPDLIHAHDLICLPTASKIAKELNIPYIYDAHELEVHRNPPLPFFQKKFVKYIEKKHSKKAECIITVGRYVAEELKKYLKNKNIYVIYNSPKINFTSFNLREDLNLDSNKKILIYVGKVAIGRGIEDIIKLLPNISNDIVFVTVGPFDIKHKEFLEKMAKNYNIEDRFFMLPPVKYDQVVNYIKSADLGIISVQPVTLSYQYSMPNKLFELSFANVPILSNELDEIKEFINEYGNGEVIDINDKVKLTFFIEKMIKTKNNYIMSEETYKNLYNKYSWETQENKLLKIYQNIFNEKKIDISR